MSLTAYRSGVIAPGDEGPPIEAMAFRLVAAYREHGRRILSKP